MSAAIVVGLTLVAAVIIAAPSKNELQAAAGERSESLPDLVERLYTIGGYWTPDATFYPDETGTFLATDYSTASGEVLRVIHDATPTTVINLHTLALMPDRHYGPHYLVELGRSEDSSVWLNLVSPGPYRRAQVYGGARCEWPDLVMSLVHDSAADGLAVDEKFNKWWERNRGVLNIKTLPQEPTHA